MAQTDNPLVSMIVVCYNQARFVVETLESVKAQTYQLTELIILDDCSSDGSVAVIENWLRENRIECTFIRHEKNQGTCKTVNDALAVATGKYISMIASDDVWLPDKIARQVEIMESQPDDVGVLYSDAFRLNELGDSLPSTYLPFHHPELSEVPPRRFFDALLYRNFIPGMTTLVRRSCYDTVGYYDEATPAEDWDMWLRIARHYSFLYLPTPVAKYRIHQDSFSYSDPLGMFRATIQAIIKQLAIGGLNSEQESALSRALDNSARHLYATVGDVSKTTEMIVAAVRQVSLPGFLLERLRDSLAWQWVPAVMGFRVPLSKKRLILKLVRELDPYPFQRAMRPALNTISLKAKSVLRRAVPAESGQIYPKDGC
jgi:glycosyltransferase involved in cell wall biosynthesis